MQFLGAREYRCIAHDQRGHARSSQPWHGDVMEAYAHDLAALVAALDLRDAIRVGHPTGGDEVACCVRRHGTGRVAKAMLISAVPPLMLETGANPRGPLMKAFDDNRAGVLADRSQFFKDFTAPSYGANRPGVKVSKVGHAVIEGPSLHDSGGDPARLTCRKVFHAACRRALPGPLNF